MDCLELRDCPRMGRISLGQYPGLDSADAPLGFTLERAGMSDESDFDRDRLVRILYDELHRVAVRLMRRQRPGHTLQPSALVNEALMRLLTGDLLDSRADRRIVLGAAVQAMRSVLTDHHRRREAGKRGGALQRHPLDGVLLHFEDREKLRYLDLDAAIDELARLEPRQASGRHLPVLPGDERPGDGRGLVDVRELRGGGLAIGPGVVARPSG